MKKSENHKVCVYVRMCERINHYLTLDIQFCKLYKISVDTSHEDC